MEITNYRSCVDTTFEPNPNLSVLIGPNGSGKTTVLSAFQLLSKLLGVNIGYRRRVMDSFSTDCILKVGFSWRAYSITYEAKISLVNNERNEDEILDAAETWYSYSIIGSRKKFICPLVRWETVEDFDCSIMNQLSIILVSIQKMLKLLEP
ncbi:AAA family ATPase [Pseudomonas syringae]